MDLEVFISFNYLQICKGSNIYQEKIYTKNYILSSTTRGKGNDEIYSNKLRLYNQVYKI